MKKAKEIIILVVEDDDGHAELIIEGLVEAGVCNEMKRFSNGQELWNFLNDEKNLNSMKGYILLLDINMPIMDGVEVLKKIKADDILKECPVVMLTTTDDPREVEECYKLGCSFYITKPVDFQKFSEILQRIGLFIQIVKL
jgi:CheY-like chemotaxis protein